MSKSQLANVILYESPILSGLADDTVEIYTEVYNIIDNRGEKNYKELNQEVLEFMLEKDAITYENAKDLIDRNKIFVENADFVEKYKEG